ncbi:MAG: ATP-grasp domain-containing protein [Bacteroidota bacterium]
MMKKTFLLISGCFKGEPFIKACKEAGNRVYLVTSSSLRDKPWPFDHIDEIFYMEGEEQNWNMEHLTAGTAHLFRKHNIDRIVALDDFDVEKATALREHFRIPGMGQTTGRYFRDKLAMRIKAQEEGIPVPAFSPLFNDEDINAYADQVEAPWVVKPRAEASATGIKKVHSKDELWQVIHSLGDKRDQYLVEQFKPGDVYHVDSLSQNGKLEFCRVSRYMDTPFEVAHGGGIFRSATVPFGSKEDKALQKLTAKVMKAFGMNYSASHTEFIQNRADGKFYFLETSSRVGGAHLAEMVEASSGINLWAEWAKLETAVANGTSYQLPAVEKQHAGIVVSLAREMHPDTSSFSDPEIWWRLNMDYHIGMIVKSEKRERITELLDKYAARVGSEFHASAPSK